MNRNENRCQICFEQSPWQGCNFMKNIHSAEAVYLLRTAEPVQEIERVNVELIKLPKLKEGTAEQLALHLRYVGLINIQQMIINLTYSSITDALFPLSSVGCKRANNLHISPLE